ncbi:RBP27 homolog [Trypanosoma brucei gambiense DAL972]|uniref:RNA-binding protein, putative n=2 Tax=Trypanosoma brucei TaxID=5691 RepID=D0A069_TRYB9|nr:RBP27 homolog [Trypanosoma brucei gambiense DAL972]RHW69757.1 RNA-binding protein 27 [Trypanosoma brucei equiperdum]CBH16627.1 RBP27 homolog [Trypanosoma brucei gambiense DAL972]|eukprot:XP_011778891.1 RBP27 homolog [Trypanosoma brucei gambiense DAL972]
MADRGDARVVHVFVDDLSAVLAEDVHEWLRIIGDIDELKMRYDASRQRSFYWVRFHQSSAARLAVDHLDGERLKNHAIEIHSNVFKKQTAAVATLEGAAGGVQEEKTKLEMNPNLPKNHLMPRDLQMDELLVRAIPEMLETSEQAAEGGELLQRLLELQESYCRAQESLERTTEGIRETDGELTALLRGETTAATDVSGPSSEGFVQGNTPLASARIRNAVPVPLSTCDPAGLLSKLTRHVGPVADYAFSFASNGGSFATVVELFHPDDADFALTLLTGRRMVSKSTEKHADAEDALEALVGFGWEAEASVAPLTPPSVPQASFAAHNRVATILRSCQSVA